MRYHDPQLVDSVLLSLRYRLYVVETDPFASLRPLALYGIYYQTPKRSKY